MKKINNIQERSGSGIKTKSKKEYLYWPLLIRSHDEAVRDTDQKEGN